MAFNAYDAATHEIGRARRLLEGAQIVRPRYLRDKNSLRIFRRKDTLAAETVGDMRRLSVVMAVAALDTYMHRLIVERTYIHEELPGGLASLDVRFGSLLDQADATDIAARAQPYKPKSRVGVKKLLRDRLLRETFQNSDAVSRALGMAGRPGAWEDIAKEMSPPLPPKQVKKRLNKIVMRRNQIVHEGDYQRLEKPRGPKRNGMTSDEAKSDIDFLAGVIDAIHAVVS